MSCIWLWTPRARKALIFQIIELWILTHTVVWSLNLTLFKLNGGKKTPSSCVAHRNSWPFSSSRLDYKQRVSLHVSVEMGHSLPWPFKHSLGLTLSHFMHTNKVSGVKHSLTTDQKEGVLLAFTLISYIFVKYEYTAINLHSLKVNFTV